jgi:LemA protein
MDGIWLWILLIPGAIVVIALLVLVYYYNRIRVLSNRIDNAWSQIDVQLKKRADLVPNLVNTVKGYMKHEKDAIKMVTEAREKMMGAGSTKDRMKAEDKLSKALKTIFALAENYPNLKASENFKLLQEQLEGIENKVAYSRQFYNDSVLEFNNLITTVPGRWFAGGRTAKEYFEATESERAPVKVEF